MKKTVLSSIILALFLTNVCTAQSILDNYLNAIGGKERIDSIKTATIEGTVVSTYVSGLNSIISSTTFTGKIKRDYKYRTEYSNNDGRSSVFCYNGSELTGTNKAAIAMRNGLDREYLRFSLFSNVLFAPSTEIKQKPDEVLNGKKCNVLSVTDNERNIVHKYFFDPETHLLFAANSYGSPTFYENYQLTGGILFPMQMTQTSSSGDTVTEYTSIILNPDLPDEIFDCNPD